MNNHIQNIEISNFKSIKDLKISGCKKINIFAGKPNAGKSNILEGIGLHDAFFSDENLKEFVRFVGFSDLFFEGNLYANSNLKLNDELVYFWNLNGSEQLSFHFINKESESSLNNLLDRKDYLLNGNLKTEQNINVKSNLNVRKYNFTDYKYYLKNFYTNHLISPNGENLPKIISLKPDIREFVNKLFYNNNLRLLIEKNSNDLKIFKEYEDGTVFNLPYSMIADTLQRLIFYKAAIMSNENSVLLFEEPEAHCFEPYILEFTNEVKYNENNNQFFIVTHSDFIIQEFLRDEESRKDTQIYLVNNVGGETKVKALEQEKNDDVYEFGMNVFFNFDSLWENN